MPYTICIPRVRAFTPAAMKRQLRTLPFAFATLGSAASISRQTGGTGFAMLSRMARRLLKELCTWITARDFSDLGGEPGKHPLTSKKKYPPAPKKSCHLKQKSLRECVPYPSQGSTFLHPDIFPADTVTKMEDPLLSYLEAESAALWGINFMFLTVLNVIVLAFIEFAAWTWQLLVYSAFGIWSQPSPWILSPYRKSIWELNVVLLCFLII